MKKRLLWVNIGVVTVGVVASFFLAFMIIQHFYREEFGRRLDTALALMSAQQEEIDENPEAFAIKASQQLHTLGQEIRITIVSPEGVVLGESNPDGFDIVNSQDTLKNHLSRPEIQEALKNGTGDDIRLSASLNIRFYYRAAYIKDRYFIRAAMPVTEMDSLTFKMLEWATLGLIIGIALSIFVTLVTTRNILEPIEKLTQATKKIADGEYGSHVPEGYKNEAGQLAAAFNEMSDNLEHAMRQLQNKQDQLESVLQGMDDGVLAIDAKGRILFLNDRLRMHVGNPELKEGAKLEGNMVLTRLGEIMRRVRLQAEPAKDTIVLSLPEPKILAVYAAPLCSEQAGETGRGTLAVLSDVTRMRRLEQMRSEFVANVTHELKTPLTSIRGFIELLKDGERDEETRRYFYDVLDIEAERLHHLIDDLLVLSQIENTREDPTLTRCNLQEELKATVERLAPVAEKNGIAIELDAAVPLYVLSSSTRLQQLFYNLIENAIKYNVKDGRVYIRAVSQRKMALVQVRDTGIGIPPEHLNRIFERFYRVDASRSKAIGGTGLGLSIVKHLVSLYNGDISVESTVGVGTAFTVRLPLDMKAEGKS